MTAGVTGLAGCSGDNDDSDSGGGDTASVEMVTSNGEYYFDPIGLFIETGETVTFENVEGGHSTISYKDGVGQATTTRIPDGAQSWESSILTESGATFEHTFETAGTYDYYCGPHKSLEMVGRIVVGDPGGPAEGSMPPDSPVPESQSIVDSESVSHQQFSG